MFNFKQVEDEDLFIDFKLDLHTKGPKPNDIALFNLLRQARKPEERGNRDDSRRGAEFETMPYFLTDQFKQVFKTAK